MGGLHQEGHQTCRSIRCGDHLGNKWAGESSIAQSTLRKLISSPADSNNKSLMKQLQEKVWFSQLWTVLLWGSSEKNKVFVQAKKLWTNGGNSVALFIHLECTTSKAHSNRKVDNNRVSLTLANVNAHNLTIRSTAILDMAGCYPKRT